MLRSRHKILVIDELLGERSEVAGQLKNRGYTVHLLQGEEKLDRSEIESFDLIVHFYLDSTRFKYQCEEWMGQNTHLSYLAISASGESFLKGVFSGRRVKALKHLQSQKKFLKTVGDLIHRSQMKKRIQKSVSPVQSRQLELILASSSLEEAVKKTLRLLSWEAHTKFAFWIPRDHLVSAQQRRAPQVISHSLIDVKRIETFVASLRHHLLLSSGKPGDIFDFTSLMPFQSLLILPMGGEASLGFFVVGSTHRAQLELFLTQWKKLEKLLGGYFQTLHLLEESRALTLKDDLTDLFNQRFLSTALDLEIARFRRQATPFSLLFLDVDYLKSINDKYGHLVGSTVIKNIGKIIKSSVRNSDYAFRYGGDEFIVVLTGADSKNAFYVAERIRKEVEKHVFRVEGTVVNVTMSIGVAGYPEHAQNHEDIIKLADRAMYNAKKKTRNVVFIAS